MKEKQGFIKLWRSFGDTAFFRDSHCVHLAIYLLLKASINQHSLTNTNDKPIVIRRGQCVVGRKKMSFDTGISEQSIRTTLANLRKLGFLTIKSTKRFSIISIVNFGRYQEKSTNTSTISNRKNQPTANHIQEGVRRGDKKNTPLPPAGGTAGVASHNPEKGPGEGSRGPHTRGEGEPPKRETAEAYIVRRYMEACVPPSDFDIWRERRGERAIEYALKIINTFDGHKKYATDWVDDELVKLQEWAKKTGKDFSLALLAHRAFDARAKFLAITRK